jgi:hypothetical protein
LHIARARCTLHGCVRGWVRSTALLARRLAPQTLGQTEQALLALPNWSLPPGASRGVLLAASRGSGAWVRTLVGSGAWTRASADAAATLRDVTVCISDHEVWAATPMAAAAAPVVPAALLPLCCGSLVKYAAVALGQPPCSCSTVR